MSASPQWSPPGWARLLVYLAGAAMFVVQPVFYPPPNFWFLAMDSIVLIGLSESVFKQFAHLVLSMVGKSPPAQPKDPPEPKPTGEV
jgi:hypothetical protein